MKTFKEPRDLTYSLGKYVGYINHEDIRSDADVQRLSGQWENSMNNALLYTILTNDYIPPIILAEEILDGGGKQKWIIDGLQRSTCMTRFRYANYRITRSIDQYLVYFQRKITENGKYKKDNRGNYLIEIIEYDIRNKTYEDLPPELKARFDEYQLRTVVHEDCDRERMSYLIQRYNNHKAMNASQKAFTFVPRFARTIREIAQGDFFIECKGIKENDIKKGTTERIVMECMNGLFFYDHWKKTPKDMAEYINENCTEEQFEILEDYFNRLDDITDEKNSLLFTSKNTLLWVMLFDRFTKCKLRDEEFGRFLDAFINELSTKEIDGVSFDSIDKSKSSKDKGILEEKLTVLTKLMDEFFGFDRSQVESSKFLTVRNYPLFEGMDVDEEKLEEFFNEEDDMEFYCQCLEDWLMSIPNYQKVLEKKIWEEILGFVKYVYDNDISDDKGIKAVKRLNESDITENVFARLVGFLE